MAALTSEDIIRSFIPITTRHVRWSGSIIGHEEEGIGRQQLGMGIGSFIRVCETELPGWVGDNSARVFEAL